jgi:isoquinoline 1-oxidoreductase beta subunit
MARAGEEEQGERGITRRHLLVGGGVGVGLVLAWTLWPRRYSPNIRANPGETILNAFLKIGKDGRVIVIVPQAELGQGVATALPQILADELGADWRSIGVEPAPLNQLYANELLADELSQGAMPQALEGVRSWTAKEIATREALMLTGGSTSIRAFEPRLREAGAAARALLTQVAARRWNDDWRTLSAHGGFVWRGEEAIAFGDLAEAAAGESIPSDPPRRTGAEHRLTGQPQPRLDAPGKVDGSALFAADVRLPDMVFAATLSAPSGASLISADDAAGNAIPEALMLFQNPAWVGAVATNSWAAERAVVAMKPTWSMPEPRADTRRIDAALNDALNGGEFTEAHAAGDVEAALGGQATVARYAVGLAPSAPPETLTATARVNGDTLEVWAPTQAPGLARAAAAAEIGFSESQVTIYPMLAVGGGYGRKLEMDAIRQATIMSYQLGRPVQLAWSRLQDILNDRFRPAAMAELQARLASNGTIAAWRARIAAPATARETAERIGLDARLFGGSRAPVSGAVPPYNIPNVSVSHAEANIGVPTGISRSGALSYTTFFTESFIDELARKFGLEPFSFRIQLLGQNPRLAKALTTATALGGWDGAPSGSGMGLAALSAFGSHIATLVEVEVGADQRPRVLRAVCAVDCGRVINPELVRQQIEGGLIHGIAGATGAEVAIEGGFATARNLGDLQLPRLADSPTVTVELIESDAEPGGVTELAVPTAAPAIANALHALTGERVRRLPLRVGGGR